MVSNPSIRQKVLPPTCHRCHSQWTPWYKMFCRRCDNIVAFNLKNWASHGQHWEFPIDDIKGANDDGRVRPGVV